MKASDLSNLNLWETKGLPEIVVVDEFDCHTFPAAISMTTQPRLQISEARPCPSSVTRVITSGAMKAANKQTTNIIRLLWFELIYKSIINFPATISGHQKFLVEFQLLVYFKINKSEEYNRSKQLKSDFSVLVVFVDFTIALFATTSLCQTVTCHFSYHKHQYL